MDEFTQKLMATAQERQKKLDLKMNDLGLHKKLPLHESQPNMNSSNKIDEINLLKRREVQSDSNLSNKADSQSKENYSKLTNSPKSKLSLTKVSSDIPGKDSPLLAHKTLNIQKENFEMQIKLKSTDDMRVEVQIEERDENDDSDINADAGDNNEKESIVLQKNDGQESVILEKNEHNQPALRKDAKTRLQRLGQLYSTEEVNLSSPIHRTEEKFHEELSSATDADHIKRSQKSESNEARRKRFAALATDRKNWEDDLSHPKNVVRESTCTTSKSPRKKSPAPKPPTEVKVSAISPARKTHNKPPAPKPPKPVLTTNAQSSTSADKQTSTKQLQWDKTVLDNLESQGFSRTESTSRLIFDYSRASQAQSKNENKKESNTEKPDTTNKLVEKDEQDEQDNNQHNIISTQQNDKKENKKIMQIAKKFDNKVEKFSPNNKPTTPKSPSKSILSKTALFENASPSKQKDPALLSVSERKALFEKHKGEALVPKAAFAMPIPVQAKSTENTKNDNKHTTKDFARANASEKISAQAKTIKSETTKPVAATTTTSATENSGIAGKLKALLQQATTISESQIRKAREQEKQRELDMLKNRFNKNKTLNEQQVPETTSSTQCDQYQYQSQSESESESESEEDEQVTETTKMIREQKNKIVTFKQSRESLASLASKKSANSVTVSEDSNVKDAITSTKKDPPKRRSSGDHPIVQAVLEDVKRIKVTGPKNGKLYPCLSDIEASTTATEDDATDVGEEQQSAENTDDNNSSCVDGDESSIAESDLGDTSFGREILDAVNRSQISSQKRTYLDDSTTSDLSDVLNDMNEYLNGQSTESDTGPTPPKNTRFSCRKHGLDTLASDSFHYQKSSTSSTTSGTGTGTGTGSPLKNTNYSNSPKKCSTIEEEKHSPTNQAENDSNIPLIHTVSFYRRQQNHDQRTPVKKIVRQENCTEITKSTVDQNNEEKLVDEKIQRLTDEISKHQTVISQTSQALNLCRSTVEFSGSSEEVEAERLLLLATQRRQAALHEIQRLRVERTLRPSSHTQPNYSIDSCSLKISDIVLPLKKDYLRALTAAGGLGHHLLCLVRYGEHIFATPLVPTGCPPNPPQPCVRIPGTIKLEQLPSDFIIKLEVYSMPAHEEVLPHEVKYHIGGKDKKSGKLLLTPKKSKPSQESKLYKTAIESPAGPSAVRTSSFQMIGFVIFSIKEIKRTQWSLNKMPYISPLEGVIQMHIDCDINVNVEMRGFLTMFEDVSGFGAWHRRWCYLKGDTLSYWKYPDDERKKAPVNSISLQGCVTEHVSLVSRDICARPHTFLLEFIRPKQPDDSDSLVMVVQQDKTLIRHLLSADTKEERIEWCQQLNKALTSMKAWSTTSSTSDN